jgi:hypothetical protein
MGFGRKIMVRKIMGRKIMGRKALAFAPAPA